jgi:hypothetical protein
MFYAPKWDQQERERDIDRKIKIISHFHQGVHVAGTVTRAVLGKFRI